MEDLEQRIRVLRADVDALVATSLDGIDGASAARHHDALRGAVDKLQGYAVRLLARIEAEGRWSAESSRTFPEWVAKRQGSSVGKARSEVALGQAFESDLPATSVAVTDGTVTFEHAQVLARFGPTSSARRAALASDLPDRNESFLVEQARRLPVDEYRRAVKRWAAAVDPVADERGHAVATAKEHLILSPRDDGVAFQGFVTTEHGAVLATALRAVTGVPSATDDRSAEQRQAGALVDMARIVLDRGLAGGGQQVRPHLSVHVSWETMQQLMTTQGDGVECVACGGDASGPLFPPAELDNGEPIPASVLARLACDSEISRIVFGPDSEVLDVGRDQRTYSGHLRRAIVARDRHCQHPGCTAPPALCEVHHIVSWASGGATSLLNGVLLCWFHHDVVHRRHLAIRRSHGTCGAFEFVAPDGRAVTEGEYAGQVGAAAVEMAPPVHRPEGDGGVEVDKDHGLLLASQNDSLVECS